MREIIKKKWNKYRNKPKSLWDGLFFIIILAYIAQVIIWLTSKETMQLVIPKNLVNFFVVQSPVGRNIIDLLGLSFNVAIIIAIANKASLKTVYKKMWLVLLLIYPLDTIPVMVKYGIPTLCMVFANIRFAQTAILTIKEKWLSFAYSMIIISLMAGFQFLIMCMRFDGITTLDIGYSFLQELILGIEMLFLFYVYYKKQLGR